jgi:hypothetical protein
MFDSHSRMQSSVYEAGFMHSPKQLQVIHFGTIGSDANSLYEHPHEGDGNNHVHLFGHEIFGHSPPRYTQHVHNLERNDVGVVNTKSNKHAEEQIEKNTIDDDNGIDSNNEEDKVGEDEDEEDEDDNEPGDDDDEDEEYTDPRTSKVGIHTKSATGTIKRGTSTSVVNQKPKKQVTANRKHPGHTLPANLTTMDPKKRYCKYRQYGCNHRGFLIKQTSKCIERHETCCSKRFYEPVRQYRASQFNQALSTSDGTTVQPTTASHLDIHTSENANACISHISNTTEGNVHEHNHNNKNKIRVCRKTAQSTGPCRNTRSFSKGRIDTSVNSLQPRQQEITIEHVNTETTHGSDMMRSVHNTPVSASNTDTKNNTPSPADIVGDASGLISSCGAKRQRLSIIGHVRKLDESTHTMLPQQNAAKKPMIHKTPELPNNIMMPHQQAFTALVSTDAVKSALSLPKGMHPLNPITDAVRGRNISSPHIDSLRTNVDAILHKIENSNDLLSSQRDNSVRKKDEFTTVAQNYIKLLSVNPAKLAHQKQQIMSQLKNKFERSFEKSTLATTHYFEQQKKQYEAVAAATRFSTISVCRE